MTRPRGTIIVRLRRDRALAFANWLSSFQIQEKTVLGTAGMTVEEIEAEIAQERALLAYLTVSLSPASTGRPRRLYSNYYLSRSALQLIDTGWAALTMSLRLAIIYLTQQIRSPIAFSTA